MQSLYLVLPGIVPGEIYGVPLKGDGMPQRLILNAEPWDVVRIDVKQDPIKIMSLFSPKKLPPKKKLLSLAEGSVLIGKGQKVLVPAQPASGKTTLLKNLGNMVLNSTSANITNLLIDERPEETLAGPKVNNINLSYMRSAKDILIGTLDTIAGVMKRVIEKKTDEVIFMDSLTRLVEVANSVIQTENPDLPSGTGGVALSSRKFVRQILGLGNNLQGGSLTIISTCLVGGSSLEDVVYKDLKGVSNAELFILTTKKGHKVIDPRKSYVRNQRLIK
jgi:transcription termination factor Rho